ncbi:MAG: phosphatidate cytidylyltransferase [Lachnospiraceae bacterium]|nr:phosphatidate cytidylyltransferase [Ruminococcus sp.]MCM1275041.1 phosphatidate cytidylyltransferase [Lachnospiraceae bacterium]
MLKRIVTALIGIVVGVSILFIDNEWLYMAVLAIFGAIGAWEIIHAVKCEKHRFLCWFCVAFAAFVPFLLNVPQLKRFTVVAYLVYVLVLLSTMLFGHKTVKFENIATCGSAALVIPTSLSCIIFIRYLDPTWGFYPGVFMVVYLLFCAWFGDSGAYFVGTFLGKHKLCPDISPKKTVEGLIGGIITVGVVVAVQCLVYNLILPTEVKMSYAVLIPVGMVACGVGVLGDLSASVIKRQYDVKDFGNLMPGHGGVLDRFDSVLFVAPFLYVVFKFLSPIMQ